MMPIPVLVMDGKILATRSGSHTLGAPSELDYYDYRSVPLSAEISALDAWNIMTAESGPLLRLAFRIRDGISSRFGVKRIGGFSGNRRVTVQAGERLDFFLVEDCAPDRLVLTERDRHLDVMICLSIADRVLTITSSVITHNTFGRLYMLPVRPAHKLIVNRYMARLQRKLQQL